MSSNSRPRSLARSARLPSLCGAITSFAFALALAAPHDASAAGTIRKNTANRRPPPKPALPAVSAADDSTVLADEQLQIMTGAYGGREVWLPMQGIRYDVVFTIPGPEGVPVRTWAESHFVWTRGEPRVRVDNLADSTIVVVDGDTTWVRREGAWTTDSTAVATERTYALDARWLARIPYSVLGEKPKRRIEQPAGRDTALVVRAEYGPGEDRPAGTVARVKFAPPTFGLGTVHWYDPRSRAWFLLELQDERVIYGWRYAERRTLRTSDATGAPGPVVLEARVENLAIASEMPDDLLHPPGRP